MRFFYFLIILSFTLTSCASKAYYLSKQLNEISGIDDAFHGVYFSINDSGRRFVRIFNKR